MRFALLSLLPIALAAPAAVLERAAKPVYWLLAGDSTTATNGGWGDGFLSTTVASGSTGRNYGHSGATTRSFRAGGDWAKVISDTKANKEKYRVYVTIQFGHNDQKDTSGVTPADFRKNLDTFASEVVAAGGTPILVTSLTRRSFDSKTGKVVENLANESAAAIDVAKSKNLHYIDLNRASTDYVNKLGQKNADLYNLAGPKTDRTHVNTRGEKVFARMVSDLLVAKYPNEFKEVTKPDAALSAKIKNGELA